ncbi:MAG: LCP family protein [Defluviitaleaceae bacterium]|nr:LCP family protein [Defluviitaleaceae bacterium]
MRSLLITIIATLAIATTVVMAWNRVITPPAPQEMAHRPMPPMQRPTNPDQDTPDYQDDEPDVEYVWPAPERFTDDDRREYFWTFLIIGLNEGRNANTVMAASYCGITREAHIISIPRDVAISTTRRGHAQKLASSYLAGAGGGRGRAGGIAQVQMDVMNVIGFIPDYYVVIDYDTFFTIIDAVDGIYVYVPIRMRYSDPCQNLNIDIMPGLQHMDSATALEFSRFRQANRNSGYPSLPDGDIGRTRNQQAVVNAVISRLLTPASILRIPQFVGIFNDSVYTNLTFSEMMFFALELNHVRGADALFTDTFVPVRTSGLPYYHEFLNPESVLELINSTINPFKEDIELRDLNIFR